METNGEREKGAFFLKRNGQFKEALKAYAHEYAESLKRESDFVAEQCFREMFDSALLLYLQQDRRFETKRELLEALKGEIAEALKSEEAYDRRSEKYFQSFQGRLVPRGRGKPLLSVDIRLLLEKERAALLRR